MSLEKPNYNNYADRDLYDKLLCEEFEKRTQLEDEFIKSMYHQEMFYYDALMHGGF